MRVKPIGPRRVRDWCIELTIPYNLTKPKEEKYTYIYVRFRGDVGEQVYARYVYSETWRKHCDKFKRRTQVCEGREPTSASTLTAGPGQIDAVYSRPITIPRTG